MVQPAHGLERCSGAGRAREAPAARCTGQISAPPVKPRTSQPDPLNDAASLGGALLRVANALEQKHGSLGDCPRRFRAKPSNREFSGGIRCHFRDQSSREAFGASRLGGQALIARVVRTRKERPEVVIAAHESRMWRRHDDVCLLPRCGNFRSLRRFDAMTAVALDEGRSGNLQSQTALPHRIHAVLESVSQDPAHEMEWGWPILGTRRAECHDSLPQGMRRP